MLIRYPLGIEAKEGQIEINRIASVYGRTGFSAMKLRYLNKQKSPDLVRLVRVQFPLSGSPNQGSANKILTPSNAVKQDKPNGRLKKLRDIERALDTEKANQAMAALEQTKAQRMTFAEVGGLLREPNSRANRYCC